MPRLFIDWRYTELDMRTIAAALQLLRREFSRSALGELILEPDEADIEQVIRRDGAYGGHHIGTLRMGRDPTTAVVDANCRVFGVGNLYVAGSAVFPTSGQANPTLTIVALAIRLARHLEASARRTVEVARSRETVTPPHLHARAISPVVLAETMSGRRT
jgi:choline dehydrogenase-like flavoprotein